MVKFFDNSNSKKQLLIILIIIFVICGVINIANAEPQLQPPQLSGNLEVANAVLSWTSSQDATSYILEKSTDGTNFSQLIETAELTHSDSNLYAGNYYYRVKAKNSVETSVYSNIIQITVNLTEVWSGLTWEKYDHGKGTVIGDDIYFYGYTQHGYSDFWYYDNQVEGKEIFSFILNEDEVYYHSFYGGGFIFGAKKYSDNTMEGYVLLFDENTASIKKIPRTDMLTYSNTDGNFGYQNLISVQKEKGIHNIKMEVDRKKVSVWDNNNIIINYTLPAEIGNGIGIVADHNKHNCSETSTFIFGNLEISYGLPGFTVFWPTGGTNVEVDWTRGSTDLSGNMVQLWRTDTISGIWIPAKDISEAEKDEFIWHDDNVTTSLNYKYQVRVYDPGIWDWRVVAESDWAALEPPFPAPGGLRILSKNDMTATITWVPISGADTYLMQISTDEGNAWQDYYTSGPPMTVPMPCMLRVKAGNHLRSQFSGMMRVN